MSDIKRNGKKEKSTNVKEVKLEKPIAKTDGKVEVGIHNVFSVTVKMLEANNQLLRAIYAKLNEVKK